MAPPIHQEKFLRICQKVLRNGLEMTFQAIPRAQNLHTPRYKAGKHFHNGHGDQWYGFFTVFRTPKSRKNWGRPPWKVLSYCPVLIPRGINMDQYEGTFHGGRPQFFLDFRVRKTWKNQYSWSPWPLWKCLPTIYLGVCNF